MLTHLLVVCLCRADNNNLKLWSDVRLEGVFDKVNIVTVLLATCIQQPILLFLIVNRQAGRVTATHHVQTINLERYNLYNIYNVQRLCFEVWWVYYVVLSLPVD